MGGWTTKGDVAARRSGKERHRGRSNACGRQLGAVAAAGWLRGSWLAVQQQAALLRRCLLCCTKATLQRRQAGRVPSMSGTQVGDQAPGGRAARRGGGGRAWGLARLTLSWCPPAGGLCPGCCVHEPSEASCPLGALSGKPKGALAGWEGC